MGTPLIERMANYHYWRECETPDQIAQHIYRNERLAEIRNRVPRPAAPARPLILIAAPVELEGK